MPETFVVTTKTFRREKSSLLRYRRSSTPFFNTKSKCEPSVEVRESEEQIIHAWSSSSNKDHYLQLLSFQRSAWNLTRGRRGQRRDFASFARGHFFSLVLRVLLITSRPSRKKKIEDGSEGVGAGREGGERECRERDDDHSIRIWLSKRRLASWPLYLKIVNATYIYIYLFIINREHGNK